MSMPYVSIVMPAFNAEKFICSAIDSVLSQSFKDFELIIVDDCSTDSTLQKIRSYDDSRIIIIENKLNNGISRSLNKAMDIARGKYIARIDSDDLMMSNRIEAQYNFLEKFEHIGLLGSAIEIFGDVIVKRIHKYPTQDSFIKSLMFFENPLAHPAVMYKKELVQKVGGYSESYPYVEDWDLWYRLSKVTNFHNLPDPLTKYRAHKKSSSHIHTNLQESSRLELVKHIFADSNFSFNQIFFKNEVEFSYKNLGLLYSWLLELKEENRKEKRYEFFVFEEILNKRYLNFLYRVDKQFFKVIAFYFNHQLHKCSINFKIQATLNLIYRYIINKRVAFRAR